MNWKMFKEDVPSLVSRGQIGVEFTVIPIFVVLCVVTAFFLWKGSNKRRRFIQSLALLVLAMVFMQCLCITKQIIWGGKYLIKGHSTLSLAYIWFPAIVIIFVIGLGRRFYCHWICPVGFLQDLTAMSGLHKKSKALRLSGLAISLMAVLVVMWLTRPSVIIMGAGAWLGLLTLIIAMLVVSNPNMGTRLRVVQYFILAAWAGLAATAFVVPGPWCVPAQASFKYSASVSFVCALLAAAIVPRAWCRYVCPDGALLRLLGRRGKLPLDDGETSL